MSLFQKEYYKNTKFGHIGDGSSKWKQLSETDKNKFMRLADRFNRENARKLLPQAVEIYKTGKHKDKSAALSFLVKNFGFPKKPVNPYLLFCQDEMDKNENSKYFCPENKLNWEQLSQEQKDSYVEKFRHKMKSYDREVQEFVRKLEQGVID